jgi:hypothetical protein
MNAPPCGLATSSVADLPNQLNLPLPIRSSAAHRACKADGWRQLFAGALTVAQMACRGGGRQRRAEAARWLKG